VIWAALAAAIAIAIGARGPTQSVVAVWLDEWRKHLRKHVHDDQRRATAEEILDAEAEHIETYFEVVEVQLHALYGVHRDYAATFEDHLPYIEDVAAQFKQLQHQQVAAFRKMHGTLAADEWAAIRAQVGEQIDKREAHEAKVAKKAEAKAAKSR
jgi:hypothetical protein